MSSSMMGRQIRSAVAIGLLVLVLLVIGQLLGGTNGVFIALGIALVLNVVTYWYSDKIALMAHGARPADELTYSSLHRIVGDLAQQAGIPKPKVYIIPTQSPNAFATGRDPAHASVAVTEGILVLVDERELRAVLAHELSHVTHRDILITTMATVIASAIFLLADWARWALMWGGGRGRRDSGGVLQLVFLLVLLVVTPFAVMFLQAMLSQNREYLADEGGARLGHDPLALASALKKLDQWSRRVPMPASPAYSSLYIVHASFGNFGGWFSTHPPTAERIARLEEMARTMSHLR